jgi:hypothetical protein
MYDFKNSTNTQLADMVRALHEERGLVIPAQSTLLRLKKDALMAKVIGLMGENFGIDDRGEPVAIVIETAEDAVTQAALNAEGVDAEETGDTDFDGIEDETNEVADSTNTEDLDNGLDEDGHDGVTNGVHAEAAPKATRRGAKVAQADEAVITVVTTNPKREGSAAHTRFSQMKTGMTVAAYVAAVESATGSSKNARGTLAKAIRLGHVTVG